MKIQILDKEVELKSSFRSYIIFENITGRSFQTLSTLSDVLVFMYANVLASLKDTSISFDEFLDYVDGNPDVVTQFSDWMIKGNEIIEEATNDTVEKGESKKKTRKKD